MKKKIPNLININFPYDPEFSDKLFMYGIQSNYSNGYPISHFEFDKYCALLINEFGIDQIPKSYQEYCFLNNKLKDRIQFEIIRSKKNNNRQISLDEEFFFNKYLNEKVKERKSIIRNEIARLGINSKKITYAKSDELRTLIKKVREMDDEITIIPWFVPIKLSFEKLIHIYIKHVEETKFADGAFKNRSFFNYELDEIWTLLKVILRQEEENIKNHFLEVAVGNTLGEKDKIKSYHRGFKHFPDIVFNGDRFALTIDSSGYIVKFHQKH